MKLRNLAVGGLVLFSALAFSDTAQARDAYMGEVIYTAANFCPRGSAEADGSIMAINDNTALFALLGTTYGGDGRTTFGLPDLRGRTVVHAGEGPGLSSRTQGQRGGTETVTLTAAQMPSVQVAQVATVPDAESAGAASTEGLVKNVKVGGGQAHTNLAPYLVLKACIATEGTFPSRD